MSTTAKQFLLSAKGCSGRGVQMRLLDIIQRANVRSESAKGLTAESTNAEWIAREDVMGIVATVLRVTKQTGLTKATIATADWEEVSTDRLNDHMMDYFNAKDVAALAKFYREMHDVTPKEIEDMMGEALDVTVD